MEEQQRIKRQSWEEARVGAAAARGSEGGCCCWGRGSCCRPWLGLAAWPTHTGSLLARDWLGLLLGREVRLPDRPPLPTLPARLQAEKRRGQIEAAAKAQAAAEEAQKALLRFQEEQQQRQQQQEFGVAQGTHGGDPAVGQQPAAPAAQAAGDGPTAAPMDVDRPAAAAADAQQQAGTPGAAALPAPTSATPAAGDAAAAPQPASAGPTPGSAGAKVGCCCSIFSSTVGIINPPPSLAPRAPAQLHHQTFPPFLPQYPQQEGGAGEGKGGEAERARQRLEQVRREMEANSGARPPACLPACLNVWAPAQQAALERLLVHADHSLRAC